MTEAEATKLRKQVKKCKKDVKDLWKFCLFMSIWMVIVSFGGILSHGS